jgi:O-antigen/teichoic acid export membrane protein
MPRLANDLNKGLNIRPAVLKIMGMLAAVGMVPFSLLVFFGESLFAFVFDSQWSEAGIYAAIAAPWLFFNFVVSPVSLIPAILGQQRTFLIFSLLFTLITLLGSFILGSADATIYSVLFFITGMGVVMEIFLAIWFLRIANRGRNNN